MSLHTISSQLYLHEGSSLSTLIYLYSDSITSNYNVHDLQLQTGVDNAPMRSNQIKGKNKKIKKIS
jgi:hypothetical protein